VSGDGDELRWFYRWQPAAGDVVSMADRLATCKTPSGASLSGKALLELITSPLFFCLIE
jgi:hypothetical protein